MKPEAKIRDLWKHVSEASASIRGNRLTLGRCFLSLRNLYSERSSVDVRRSSGHGTFESECLARGFRPRTVRDLIHDYQAHLARKNGEPAQTSAEKRRGARTAAKDRRRAAAQKEWEDFEQRYKAEDGEFSDLDFVFLSFARLLPYRAAKMAFRYAAKELHPDLGGNAESMARLNQLWERLEAFYLTQSTILDGSNLEHQDEGEVAQRVQ